MEKFDIIDNPHTGGVSAYFKVGNQQYYADLSCVSYVGNECMIFLASDNKVTDWGELYTSYPESISKLTLIDCIKEFVDTLAELEENKAAAQGY